MPRKAEMVDFKKEKIKIMLVAGEASGDAHAAKLVKALQELAPEADFNFFGAAGEKMREAGVKAVVKSDHLSIVGLLEIGRALPLFWNVFQKLKRAAENRKPDAVILIDFPDFNLKLAKSLKKRNLKIIYYISPQIWAWRGYRLKAIKRDVDLLLTILPFEKDWYERRGFSKVEYVGSPLAREVKAHLTREEFCKKHNLDISQPIISLLPGSRHKEIIRIFPPLLETVSLMAKENSELQFIITLASHRHISDIENAMNKAKNNNLKLPEKLLIIEGETLDALNASDAAAVTSGTATLETAIIGTPFAIVYKSSPLNYRLFRPMISVEHFGLVNLIAERRLIKEFIQDDFTPEVLSRELFDLLEAENNEKMRNDLREVSDKLGHGGASKRAAQTILRELSE
ncbi:MAG: lipid-A-disaccharide synthase [Pyrinomonadaceae bacterium]